MCFLVSNRFLSRVPGPRHREGMRRTSCASQALTHNLIHDSCSIGYFGIWLSLRLLGEMTCFFCSEASTPSRAPGVNSTQIYQILRTSNNQIIRPNQFLVSSVGPSILNLVKRASRLSCQPQNLVTSLLPPASQPGPQSASHSATAVFHEAP